MNSEAMAGRSDLHILRKLWHILCGGLGILSYYYFEFPLEVYGWFAFIVALLGFGLDFLRLKRPQFNKLAFRFLGPILRKSEAQSFSGLPFYAIGVAISIYFYQKDIAILSIFFLVIADPMASMIGVAFGKENILPNKSFQGSLACFLTCYGIVTAYTWGMEGAGAGLIAFAFLAALSGAVAELFSAFNIDDNLTIPVVGGAGMTIVNELFHIF